MRTSGMPSPSTVASAIAFGSFGSAASASPSHVANSEIGSDVAVKSLLINEFFSMLAAPVPPTWSSATCSGARLHISAKAGPPIAVVRALHADRYGRARPRRMCRRWACPSARPARTGRRGERPGEADPRQRHSRRSRRSVGLGSRAAYGRRRSRDARPIDLELVQPGYRLQRSGRAVAGITDQNGAVCRPFATTINDERGVRRYRGDACLRTDGRWQLNGVTADDALLS